MPMRPVGLGSRWFRAASRTMTARVEDARIAERLRSARARRLSGGARRAAAERRRSAGARAASIRRSAPRRWSSTTTASARAAGWREVKAAIPPARMDAPPRAAARHPRAYRCRDGSRHDVRDRGVAAARTATSRPTCIKHEFGLNPLLVTYDGNNWTDVGWRNMVRMSEAFGVDHVFVRPSVEHCSRSSTAWRSSSWAT